MSNLSTTFTNEKIDEILYEQKEKLSLLGYDIAYICVYGSQNYEMDVYTKDYCSDLDLKAIVLPSLEDLVEEKKPTSLTLEYEYGQIDVKDIRIFFDCLSKANPAYVECLYTKYYKTKYFRSFEKIRENMNGFLNECNIRFVKSLWGMMMEKQKAFSHPYPTIIEKINKYKYDPKQLHHIARLYEVMEDFVKNNKYIMISKNKSELINIKLGNVVFEDAKIMRDSYMKRAGELKDKFIEENNKFKLTPMFDEMVKVYRKMIMVNIEKSIYRKGT